MAGQESAMPRELILGTAGHIDHGKTALVKALTGIDADRLKEEKQRGITIDIGFADLAIAPRSGCRTARRLGEPSLRAGPSVRRLACARRRVGRWRAPRVAAKR